MSPAAQQPHPGWRRKDPARVQLPEARLKAAKTIIAVPVASVEARQRLKKKGRICLATPESFFAVGEWFMDFRQVSDAEVQRLLEESWLCTVTK